MTGYVGKIEEVTLQNTNFRQVLFSGKHAQLVVMCLQVGEDIGSEVHETIDQFFRVESGNAKMVMNGEKSSVGDGDAFIVSASTTHNVINAGQTELKLYTIYNPPDHLDGTIHATQADAHSAEH